MLNRDEVTGRKTAEDVNIGEWTKAESEFGGDLGMVICKVCGELLYTLPTDGVKKMYGVCQKAECQNQTER